MYGRKHIHLLTAVAALAFFAGSVQAADSRPAGMTKAEYRALMLRSEALNQQYGLGSGTYKPAAMGWQEYRALVLRSKALNARYGLAAPVSTAADGSGATLRNDAAHHGRQSASEVPSPTVLNDTVHNRSQEAAAQQSPAAIGVRVEGGFDWISAAVGAAGGSGLLLVLGVATLALRRREHTDAAQA